MFCFDDESFRRPLHSYTKTNRMRTLINYICMLIYTVKQKASERMGSCGILNILNICKVRRGSIKNLFSFQFVWNKECAIRSWKFRSPGRHM